MKKVIMTIVIMLSGFLYSEESSVVKRYAILVGANNGGDERAILRYAESDAKMVADVFSDLGGIENNDSLLLLNPNISSIERTFKKITDRIRIDGSNTRTELIFYYSGHSTEEGLLIRNDLLTYQQLKKSLEDTNADVKIGILDSCSSGAFTLLKGGKHSAAFLVDESIKTTGHAFITSSAENESAQESNLLQASFFTHFLVSALRGAADSSMDGKVSLHEAYSYASNETLARTESTQAGAQHASYDFRLSGSGDLVLTDLRNAESNIELIEEDFGRFFIRDSEDNLISEVNKKYGSKLRVSVPASSYNIIKEVDGKYYKQSISLYSGDSISLKLNMYNPFVPEKNVIRGGKSNQIEYDLNVPESTAILGWSTMDKIRELNFDFNLISKAGSLEGVQISLINAVTNDAFGAQISGLFNINGGDLSGFQLSALFNKTGGNIEYYGIQLSSLFNIIDKGSDSFTIQGSTLFNSIGSDTEGLTMQNSVLFNLHEGNAHSFTIQTSGIFNKSKNIFGLQLSGLFNNSNRINGIQLSGLFNIAKEVNGLQATTLFNSSDDLAGIQVSGLFNKADDVRGLQISLVNTADFVYGSQVGLVNINKDIKGLSFGLVNISTEGIRNFSYRFTDKKESFIDYQFGSSIFYNLFYIGLPENLKDSKTYLDVGAGFGVHIPIGSFYTEIDLSISNSINFYSDLNINYTGSNPVGNIKFGLPLWDDIAVFVGANIILPIILDTKGFANLYNYNYENFTYTFYAGIRI